MNGLSLVFADSFTMLRRNLVHARRYPTVTLFVIGIPVILYLLFVYVFGSTLGSGLAGIQDGRDAYIAYVTPGILIMAIAGGAQGTAIAVAMDMHEGIVARFRTMSIPRAAVLAGHVGGSLVQTMLALLVVLGVAVVTGFRPTTGIVGILAALGMLALVSFALTWFTVALGLVSGSVESASNTPMFLFLLPFIGSGFVPTDSMPWLVRWFAEYQPFTPMIETIRGALLGTPIGWSGPIAVGWCVAITLASYLWAVRLYNRDPVH
jgi:ABC-2 type transport system permease protein